MASKNNQMTKYKDIKFVNLTDRKSAKSHKKEIPFVRRVALINSRNYMPGKPKISRHLLEKYGNEKIIHNLIK